MMRASRLWMVLLAVTAFSCAAQAAGPAPASAGAKASVAAETSSSDAELRRKLADLRKQEEILEQDLRFAAKQVEQAKHSATLARKQIEATLALAQEAVFQSGVKREAAACLLKNVEDSLIRAVERYKQNCTELAALRTEAAALLASFTALKTEHAAAKGVYDNALAPELKAQWAMACKLAGKNNALRNQIIGVLNECVGLRAQLGEGADAENGRISQLSAEVARSSQKYVP